MIRRKVKKMKTESDDLALQTLLDVREEIAPDLDPDLLRACYEIQSLHQFNQDRSQPSIAMERLIDEVVDKILRDSEEK